MYDNVLAMPITRGAKKALRASERKHAQNQVRSEALKIAVKKYRSAPSAANLNIVFQALDKAAKRGVIKAGTASRRKSRLSRLLVTK